MPQQVAAPAPTSARTSPLVERRTTVRAGSPSGSLLHLQRSAGNLAVSSLLGQSAVQRCGGEVHAGCACAQEHSVAQETGIQRVDDESTAPVAAPETTTLTSPRFAGDALLEACLHDLARLNQGDQNISVAKVQQALIDLGHDLGSMGADSIFGSRTAAGVREFKLEQSLGSEQFGDVGPGTMGRLDALFPGPLPQCDLEDVPVASGKDADLTALGLAPAGTTLAFALPGVLCDIKPIPVPRTFADIPAGIRTKLVLHTSRHDKLDIDGPFQVFPPGSTVKNVGSISQTPIFVGLPSIPDVPQTDLESGLKNVATSLMSPKTGAGFALSETVTIEISNVPYSPPPPRKQATQNGGVYRFTRFMLPQGEHLMVEFLAAAPRTPPANASRDAAAFQSAFPGYILNAGFSGAEVSLLDQALQQVGSTARGRATGLQFTRSNSPKINAEDGSYTPTGRIINLVANAFSPTATRAGGFHEGQFTINHEFGHALADLDPAIMALFTKAATADKGPPISTNAARGVEENFAECFALFTLDRAELQALRPEIFKVLAARY